MVVLLQAGRRRGTHFLCPGAPPDVGGPRPPQSREILSLNVGLDDIGVDVYEECWSAWITTTGHRRERLLSEPGRPRRQRQIDPVPAARGLAARPGPPRHRLQRPGGDRPRRSAAAD